MGEKGKGERRGGRSTDREEGKRAWVCDMEGSPCHRREDLTAATLAWAAAFGAPGAGVGGMEDTKSWPLAGSTDKLPSERGEQGEPCTHVLELALPVTWRMTWQ